MLRGFVEYPPRLGGRVGMAAVTWLVLSGPLAVLALVLRRPLERRAWVAPGAVLVAAATLVAFALQAQASLQGRSM